MVVTVILSDVMVIMLANVSKFHEIRSGQEQWIFKGDKYILSAESMKMTVFLDIALHSLTNMSDVSKVLTASIVRAITAL
jgi:hypothetical protein